MAEKGQAKSIPGEVMKGLLSILVPPKRVDLREEKPEYITLHRCTCGNYHRMK